MMQENVLILNSLQVFNLDSYCNAIIMSTEFA